MKPTWATLQAGDGAPVTVIADWARAKASRPDYAGILIPLGSFPPIPPGGPYRLTTTGKSVRLVTLSAELRPGSSVQFALAGAEGHAS
jgi:hypothetical protein